MTALNALIFGFGLVVTLIVGSGLVTMIVAKNRAIEEVETEDDTGAVPSGTPATKS